MWSPVRKALGLGEPGYLGEWHAFRQYVRGVDGPAGEHLYVWFDADLLPGYAWSFPLPGGRANVGFGVLRDGTRRIQDMKAAVGRPARPAARARRARRPTPSSEGRHTAWPIPAGIDRATLADGRVLFVGDAAMATDVMTGEGIGQALLTGRLAAEAIIAAGALDPAARPAPLRERGPPPPRRRPPDVGRARPGARPRARRPRRDPRRSPAAATGAGATSPAGCSRTSRGPLAAHPVALAPPASLAPAPATYAGDHDVR